MRAPRVVKVELPLGGWGTEVGPQRPTADWRSYRPVVDKSQCKRCWTCVEYCPIGAIGKGDESAIIDYDFCKGCGICARECPFGAIEMVREVEEEK
jgi:2-oxoacid:acceptor oxidoreductase delta subunit (pyruvate/2-ketoisovalerate family)